MTELADLDVGELLRVYSTGEASPVEAAISCLSRIDRLDGTIGAVLTLTRESALQKARESENRWRAGEQRPLEGIPYGLKDLIAAAGVRCTGGSRLYQRHTPTENAAVVDRLDAAGAVLIGKLATYEFAAGVNEATSNPWDVQRSSTGSSSGPAAAVAARELPLAIGTDTAGSMTIPAAVCGVTALKPTFGRVPRHGVMPLSWTMDHVGPISRSARDCALALSVIAGHDDRDPTSGLFPVDDYVSHLDFGLAGIRVGVPVDWFFDVVDPQVEIAAQLAIARLGDAGAAIREVRLPSTSVVDLHALQVTIVDAELASLHEGTVERLDEYGLEFRARLVRAQFTSAIDYLKALRARHLLQVDFEAAFEKVDVLVVPACVSVAPRHGERIARIGSNDIPWQDVVWRTTGIVNLTGIPSLTIPAGFDNRGLPMAVQILARPYAEAVCLRVGHAYQGISDYHRRVPEVVSASSRTSS